MLEGHLLNSENTILNLIEGKVPSSEFLVELYGVFMWLKKQYKDSMPQSVPNTPSQYTEISPGRVIR